MIKPEVWSESEILKTARTMFPTFLKELKETSNPKLVAYHYYARGENVIEAEGPRYLALCKEDVNRDLEIAEWNERRKVYDEKLSKLIKMIKENNLILDVAAEEIGYITSFLNSLMILIRINSKHN